MDRLSEFFEKIKSCTGGDPSILEARLADDMFPLVIQVQIAADFSLRSCCPIANVDIVSFENENRSFSGIQSQLKQTVEFLRNLDVKEYDLSTGQVSDIAGAAKISLLTSEFLHQFALPNFFFHVSTVWCMPSQGSMVYRQQRVTLMVFTSIQLGFLSKSENCVTSKSVRS